MAVCAPPALLGLPREGLGRGGCCMPGETTSGEQPAVHGQGKRDKKGAQQRIAFTPRAASEEEILEMPLRVRSARS